MHRFTGGCHCGAIQVEFESSHAAADLDTRECQCGFCRTHGARTMTDPEGQAKITAPEEALRRYQFGLKTADFLLCRNCGAYIAAYFEDGEAAYATLNVNAFAERQAFTKPAASADYDAENASSRMARRRVRWTPASLVVIG